MHQRDQRLIVPEGHPFVVIDVPGDSRISGDHHFRLPSSIEGVRLAALTSEDSMRGIGVLLGRCWHHQYTALDTNVPRPGTVDSAAILEHGEAVVEELHAAGYRQELLILMSRTIWTAINDSVSISEEVQARLDSFGRASSGGSDGASSSATSSTSASGAPSAA